MTFIRIAHGVLLALFLGATSLAHALPSPDEQKLITHLISRVETMRDLKFVRNGAEHSSADAAKHLRAKYDHFKDKIGTAEEFIARCGSRSEMTGSPYRIKTGDGKEHDAGAFLNQELRKMRGGTAAG